jgi:tetratricopeptide (TPR) repeat protein
VTPGPIKPARELLGEMLLELQKPADALAAFEATLTKEPNRFRAVYGAARAAEAAGDRETARKYYARLLAIADHPSDPPRKELGDARRAASME